MNVHFYIYKNWIQYDARQQNFEWMRNGSNPPDINRFRINTRSKLKYFSIFSIDSLNNYFNEKI